jgi:hypothetical protein
MLEKGEGWLEGTTERIGSVFRISLGFHADWVLVTLQQFCQVWNESMPFLGSKFNIFWLEEKFNFFAETIS